MVKVTEVLRQKLPERVGDTWYESFDAALARSTQEVLDSGGAIIAICDTYDGCRIVYTSGRLQCR